MSASTMQINSLLNQRFLEHYPGEFLQELEILDKKQVVDILSCLPLANAISIWERISPGIAGELIVLCDSDTTSKLFSEIDPGRGALLLNCINKERRQQILQTLESSIRNDLQRALDYPHNSAGALMGTRVVFYTPDMTVEQALEKLRARKRPGVRSIYIVNAEAELFGMLEMQDLALAEGDIRLAELCRNVPAYAELVTTREEVVGIFEKYLVTELPVVDIHRRLVGIVRHRTLIGVAMEENSIDIQTMVGVSKDERALSKASFAIRKRLPWLQVNLATAFLAAFVVGVFEQTIAQVTALAVLLPVVAGQSGNTGAQAMAVTLRGVALREVWPRDWLKLIIKEASVGLWNGVAVALTTMLGVYVWSRSWGLCLIIGVSMIISMVIASVAGAAIPLLLVKSGQDPATSSSIFLTTVTDVMGFLSFLGIATLFMRYI